MTEKLLSTTEATMQPASAPGPMPATWEPGRVIKHYELIRQLGQGGMGTVFLARDARLGIPI